jgi:hypothetical protein
MEFPRKHNDNGVMEPLKWMNWTYVLQALYSLVKMTSHRNATVRFFDRAFYRFIINFLYFTEVTTNFHRFMKLDAYSMALARNIIVSNKQKEIFSSVSRAMVLP